MKEPKKLTAAKKVGLKITDIDPIRDAKLGDFIEKTEGVRKPTALEEAYEFLHAGRRRPADKKLAKRYDAARKRLRGKGLL